MTEPERLERRKAGEKADAALEEAAALKARGARIGEGWARSRRDNNFRLMLRSLGKEIPRAT